MQLLSPVIISISPFHILLPKCKQLWEKGVPGGTGDDHFRLCSVREEQEFFYISNFNLCVISVQQQPILLENRTLQQQYNRN